MTPEELEQAITALNASGIQGDALTAALKALTDAFGATVEVSDDDAVGAMEPDMAATYRATDTSDEDKATLLKQAKHFCKRAKIDAVVAKAQKSGGKAPASTGFSKEDIKNIVTEAVTKAMPGAGRPATPKANPTDKDSADKTGFSAKIKSTMSASGVSKAHAIQILAQTDRAGFNAWNKAGRPD